MRCKAWNVNQHGFDIRQRNDGSIWIRWILTVFYWNWFTKQFRLSDIMLLANPYNVVNVEASCSRSNYIYIAWYKAIKEMYISYIPCHIDTGMRHSCVPECFSPFWRLDNNKWYIRNGCHMFSLYENWFLIEDPRVCHPVRKYTVPVMGKHFCPKSAMNAIHIGGPVHCSSLTKIYPFYLAITTDLWRCFITVWL